MVGDRNLSVGIFVTVALMLMIGFMVWITGKRGDENVTYYSILFEKNVSGLMMGGPVYFLGVRVGEVVDMVIVPGDPPTIRVDLQVLESTPINEGTWATLAPQGITGVSVINLSSDEGQHAPLQASPDSEYPLIPYRDSGFSAILSSAPALIQKIETLVEQATLLMNEENQQYLTSTLKNVDTLSATLADQNSAITQLPQNLNAAVSELQITLKSVQDLLAEAGPSAMVSLEQLETASENVAALTVVLNRWVEENDQEVGSFLNKGLGQVPALIQEARSAIREIEKLMESLRESPSSIIYKPETATTPVED